MAAGVTAFDGVTQSIEDPEIGQIKFYLKQWGLEAGNDGITFREVRTRDCEDADFDDEDSLFFPINENQ